MKRKCYDIWRMFRLNVIENVFSIRFFVITLLLCILFIFSQFDVVYGMEEGKFMGYSDIIGLFINVMHYDRFKPLMIILLSGIFTTEFCKEWISHFDRFILTRCSVRGYIYGKILGNVVAIYSSMAIAVTVFILFFHFYVKLDIIDYSILESQMNGYAPYGNVILGGKPILYFVILSTIFATGVILLTLLGMVISLYFPNIFVALASPYISYYLLCSITLFLPGPMEFIGIFMGTVTISDYMGLNFLYNMGILVIFIIIASVGIRKKVERRCFLDTI